MRKMKSAHVAAPVSDLPPVAEVLGKVSPEAAAKIIRANASFEALKTEAQMRLTIAEQAVTIALTEAERDSGLKLVGVPINIAADGTITLVKQ